MPVAASTGAPTSVDPAKLYSLPEFIKCSGLSYTRIRSAARQGLEPPTLKVGKRLFLRGSDAIRYIEQLAAHYAAQQKDDLEG
jgi:hypothetical protein